MGLGSGMKYNCLRIYIYLNSRRPEGKKFLSLILSLSGLYGTEGWRESPSNWPVKGLCGRCFIRVYRPDSQSCWYFRPSFVNWCPSNLLSGSPPLLPPFPVSKYKYIQKKCGWEGGEWRWALLETIFCSLRLCIWPDSGPTKLLPPFPVWISTRYTRIQYSV